MLEDIRQLFVTSFGGRTFDALFLGLLLEFFLHIRLCCCLIAHRITSAFLREQQFSLYILYIFICLTVTSLPFYFYRASEILFDSHLSPYQHPWINSCTFAQLLLCGISVQPVLYAILLLPAKALFRLKCYTSIQMPTDVQMESNLLLTLPSTRSPRLYPLLRSHQAQYSLRMSSFYPRFHLHLRTVSQPILTNNDEPISPDFTHV